MFFWYWNFFTFCVEEYSTKLHVISSVLNSVNSVDSFGVIVVGQDVFIFEIKFVSSLFLFFIFEKNVFWQFFIFYFLNFFIFYELF